MKPFTDLRTSLMFLDIVVNIYLFCNKITAVTDKI